MMKRTTIFVLFKEYPDPNGRGKSAPYIQDSADYLSYPEELMRDWMDVFRVLDFFAFESTNKYYDDENLQGLMDVAAIFPDYYPHVETVVQSGIQRVGLTSRRTNPIAKTDIYRFGVHNVTNDLLGDMAQREKEHLEVLTKVRCDIQKKLLPKDKEYEPCVLLQNGAIVAPGGVVRITMQGNRSIELQSVSGISQLHQWLAQHRFPYRHYKYNKKHGDAHHHAGYFTDRHNNRIPAAQLLTETGKTKALLKKAVGISEDGDLWFYDDNHTCFIYFENQGNNPQHEYHAYHLHPGEKNYDSIDIDKIRIVFPQVP